MCGLVSILAQTVPYRWNPWGDVNRLATSIQNNAEWLIYGVVIVGVLWLFIRQLTGRRKR